MYFACIYKLAAMMNKAKVSKENEIITKAFCMPNFYQEEKKKKTKQHEMMRPNDENSFTIITFKNNFSWVIQHAITMAL